MNHRAVLPRTPEYLSYPLLSSWKVTALWKLAMALPQPAPSLLKLPPLPLRVYISTPPTPGVRHTAPPPHAITASQQPALLGCNWFAHHGCGKMPLWSSPHPTSKGSCPLPQGLLPTPTGAPALRHAHYPSHPCVSPRSCSVPQPRIVASR